MKDFIATLRSSVLAGICIGIAGFGYLMSKDIIGIVLFTFGLLAVVHYGFKLFTGTVGFCGGCKGLKVGEIPKVLLGNIIGTLLVALQTFRVLLKAYWRADWLMVPSAADYWRLGVASS